jgi:putative endonuclease
VFLWSRRYPLSECPSFGHESKYESKNHICPRYSLSLNPPGKGNYSLPAGVYLLRLRSGAINTGSSRNLKKRLGEHCGGIGCRTTINDLPVAHVFTEEYPTYEEALRRETEIKGWTNKKKEALIRGDINALHQLREANDKPKNVSTAFSTGIADYRLCV